MTRRRKPITTIDDVRAAARDLGGPECRVIVTHNVYEHHSPGSRYESVTWSGMIETSGVEVSRSADSPAELVTKLAVGIRDELTAQAQRRKLTKQQRGLPAPILCLEHRP